MRHYLVTDRMQNQRIPQDFGWEDEIVIVGPHGEYDSSLILGEWEWEYKKVVVMLRWWWGIPGG